MKFDHDLARLIMLKMEESETDTIRGEFTIEGTAEKKLWYHLRILADGGFIEARFEPRGNGDDVCRPLRLTYIGVTFIETFRHHSAWENAKHQTRKMSSAAFDLMLPLALKTAKSQLGIERFPTATSWRNRHMPFDDLVGVIGTLQRRICAHGLALRENETRTRMALCDPLLWVLGWDVSDPGLVMPEYNVSGRRADYALLGPNGQPVATIEAKKLSASLEAHRMQMLNYSNASGVEYAGLTDGDRWEFYEVFKKGPLEERRILDVSISGMAAHECALRLLLLWRPNLESANPVAASEPVFSSGGWGEFGFESAGESSADPDAEIRSLRAAGRTHRQICDALGVSKGRVARALGSASVAGGAKSDAPPASGSWVSLAEYDPPDGTVPPSQVRFPDGRTDGLRHWSDILVSITEWLSSTGRLTISNVPVASSSKGYIVNDQPVHPTGNAFTRHKTVGGGLVVFTNVSSADARNHARKLLEHCGIGADAVWLLVSAVSR